MPARCSYRLIAATPLDDQSLCDFLTLFKVREVNIQKLVMVQASRGQRRCEVELQFTLPTPEHPFLDELQTRLDSPEWVEPCIEAL